MSRGQKYLLLFSYIGTKYSGLQRQVSRNQKTIKDNSVQACLEDALNSIMPKPMEDIVTCISSRTDKFVHAFMNSCHITLVHPQKGQVYCPHSLVEQANQYLNKNLCEINLLSAHLVDPEFYCREQIKSRTYYYRLAVIKPNICTSHVNKFESFLPVIELNRCGIICHPYPLRIDFEAMEETIKAFRGTHNFSVFMANSRTILDHEDDYYLRNIEIFDMNYFSSDQFQNISPIYKNIDIYSFTIKSRSFLYKQIRRMMGCVIMSGLRRIKVETIKKMLDNPRSNPWNAKYFTASPHGLFLANLEYNPKDFHAPLRPSKLLALKEDRDFESGLETEEKNGGE